MIDTRTLEVLRDLIQGTSHTKIYGTPVKDRTVICSTTFVIELPKAEVLVKNLPTSGCPYDPAGWREHFLGDRPTEPGKAIHMEDDRFPEGSVRIQGEHEHQSIQRGFYDFFNDQLLRANYHVVLGFPMVVVKEGNDLVGIVAAIEPKS